MVKPGSFLMELRNRLVSKVLGKLSLFLRDEVSWYSSLALLACSSTSEAIPPWKALALLAIRSA